MSKKTKINIVEQGVYDLVITESENGKFHQTTPVVNWDRLTEKMLILWDKFQEKEDKRRAEKYKKSGFGLSKTVAKRGPAKKSKTPAGKRGPAKKAPARKAPKKDPKISRRAKSEDTESE